VACVGAVVGQVRFAPLAVHEYQEPAGASCTFVIDPAPGAVSSVNDTESMFCGLVALTPYCTLLTV
jgi:hypothetical protein